jgi:hypothetical protein
MAIYLLYGNNMAIAILLFPALVEDTQQQQKEDTTHHYSLLLCILNVLVFRYSP